ncbi:hypothetical protein Syun_030583 [Stephania yunnanensis]|uniref:Uncharacterized protein n=1 Tax=Stephania yunnanensis TaxID=152371 RepID=A0AAP0DU82_9MAGN
MPWEHEKLDTLSINGWACDWDIPSNIKLVVVSARTTTTTMNILVVQPVDLQLGDNELAILSGTVGLQGVLVAIKQQAFTGFRAANTENCNLVMILVLNALSVVSGPDSRGA